MKRDSFIFYRSFFEALSELPDDKQLMIYRAISEYSLNFNEIDLDGISKTIFILIKPQLQANNKRYLNGNKPKTKAKQKQNRSKIEANKNVNDNVNVNNNKNTNKNIPTYLEFSEYAFSKKPNLNKETLKFKYDAWVENGWKDGNGKPIVKWKGKLLSTIPYLKEDETRVRRLAGT